MTWKGYIIQCMYKKEGNDNDIVLVSIEQRRW